MAKQPGAELIRWNKQRVTELTERVLNVNSETQLEQVRILGYLLSCVAQSPNQIDRVDIGWIGTLLTDTIERLDLALELETQKALPAAIANEVKRAAEVPHG